MRACRNETSGLVAGTSVSARGLALAAGMLTVMGVGGAGVSPAQGGIVVSSIGFGFGGGDCWGDDSLRVRVSSFNSWCDEWVHRRVAWDCGAGNGSWGYRPWGYRWNAHALARRSWYEPSEIVVGSSWGWWRDPVADVYVYRPVVIAPSRPVLLPYEPSRVVGADVDGDGYIEDGESAVLVPTAPVYVGAPVVWGPAPVVVYRTYRPWCPPRYYDDCYRRPIFSGVTVCDDDWWGSTRVSVSITIGLGSRSWNHWNRWDRCDDWRRWDDRWSGPVHGPRRDQVTINNPVFNGPVYFNGNTNVNGGVFAPNGPTQIAAGPVVAPAVAPAVVTVRESKESGRGERRSGLARVEERGLPMAEVRGGFDRGGAERVGAPRAGGVELPREALREGSRENARDGGRAEGSKILTGDEAAAVGRADRGERTERGERSGRAAGMGERSASRGEARVGELVANNEPKRPARAEDARRAERGGDERKPGVTAVAPAKAEEVKRPTSIATREAGEAREPRDSRADVRGRGVPSVREAGKREADAREGETMPRGVGRADRAGETAKGEVKGDRGVGEVTARRGADEGPGRSVRGAGGEAAGERRTEIKPTTVRTTERAVAPAAITPEVKPEVKSEVKPELKPEARPEIREAVKPTARGTRPALSDRGGEAERREVRTPRGGTGSTSAPAAGPSVNPVTTRQPRAMQPVLTPEPTEVKTPTATERAPRERSREVEGGGVRREMPARVEPQAAPASAGIPVPANTGRGERKVESPTGDDGGGRGEARVVSPRRTTTNGSGLVREAKPSAPSAGPKAEPASIPGVTPTTPARQRTRAPIGSGGGSVDQGGRSGATKPAAVSPSRVQQPGAMPGMMPGQGDEGKKPSSRGMGERRSGSGGGGVQVGGGGGSESKPGRTSLAGVRPQPSAPKAQPPQRQVQAQPQPQARPAAPAPAPAPRAAPAPAPSQPAAGPSKGSSGGGGGESKGGGGERKRG